MLERKCEEKSGNRHKIVIRPLYFHSDGFDLRALEKRHSGFTEFA